MILDVRHEGGGVFRVYPIPSELEAKEIIAYIKAQDPHNQSDRDSLSMISDFEETADELREEVGDREARVDEMEERINKVLCDLKELRHEDDMDVLKEDLSKATSYLESIL